MHEVLSPLLVSPVQYPDNSLSYKVNVVCAEVLQTQFHSLGRLFMLMPAVHALNETGMDLAVDVHAKGTVRTQAL